MVTADDTTERHAAILAELAEIGMTIARGLRDEVEAAPTPEAKARAVAAYPKIARAVRQCLALEARLRRDAAREAVERGDRANREIVGHIRRRKAQVRMWMQRAICEETPDDIETAEMRLADLYERLDDQVLDEDFALAPFREVIADLHRQLGLAPPTFGGEDADDDPDDDSPDDEAAPEAEWATSLAPEPPPREPDVHDSSG
ncbi:MAG TPA: hypothetical protein VF474_02835 [Phenylobacterium sp.]